ncbi:APC family permease [Bacillus sp. D386]|uniref:APC family permease n=1 Tax=Bacillus sp. D386 TaxID=2587155 RepID=UPI001123FDE9|nr:amino acid permease [Bacillus sp. D386]
MSKHQKKNIYAAGAVLKKEIGLKEALTIVVGVVIGSGIFFKATPVLESAGSPVAAIIAWLLGGLITLAAALTLAEIGSAIPETGGVFAYLKELYGEKFAFLFGWVQALIYIPGILAALSIVFATQATYFMPMTDLQQKLLAIGILVFVAALNIISTKLGGRIQFISTIAKMIPIIAIIVFGIIHGMGKETASLFSGESVHSFTLTSFGAAILGTLFAYEGWVSVGNMAGEMKNPQRDLPRSILFGMTIIIAAYVLINVAFFSVMSVQEIVSTEKVATDAALILFGSGGSAIISIGILISIFGTLNGYLMTGVRVPFAMAQSKIFPFHHVMGRVESRTSTPINVFIFEVVLSIIYILSGSFNTLSTLALFATWIFFVMAIYGVFILRKKRKDLVPTYRVPFYPFVPLVGIVGGVYILVCTVFTDTLYSLIGLAITALGYPVYLYLKKSNM